MTVDTGRRTAILSCGALALGITAPAAARAQGEAGGEIVIPDGVDALVRFDDAPLTGGEFGPGRHRISGG